MLRRFIIAIATVAALGISFGSTDVSAQWGGGGGHGGGFHGGGFRGGGYRGGGWRGGGGWGLSAGLLGGAILGGMLASPSYYGPGPYYYPAPGYVPEDAVAYCMQRFRSYDPNSGTYVGHDGLRYSCP